MHPSRINGMDIISNAYEYLIGKFAAGTGKKGGELYTPAEVSQLLAIGLEYRAVPVMACDYEVIPSQERIDTIADMADLEEIYNTERHLPYVACTRARDQLLVTSVEPASEFLDDLRM